MNVVELPDDGLLNDHFGEAAPLAHRREAASDHYLVPFIEETSHGRMEQAQQEGGSSR